MPIANSIALKRAKAMSGSGPTTPLLSGSMDRKLDAPGKAYVFSALPLASYDVRITSRNVGIWKFGVPLAPGERLDLDAYLDSALSISGRIVALDGETPQSAIPVQALWLSEMSEAA